MSFAALVLAVLLVAPPSLGAAFEPPSPLHAAHSHNDYERRDPLIDALKRGFVSIEADVFLKEGRLLVGHKETDLSPDRTLETLYLDPLTDWIENNDGRVFKDGTEMMLVVDIKSEADATYRKLNFALESFRDILHCTRDGIVEPGPVRVILSGRRPWTQVLQSRDRCVSMEGRFTELDSDLPSEVLPVISDNWEAHFTWRADPDFEGPLPRVERSRLRDIVQRAHEKGRIVRLWNAPDNEMAWQELLLADVDLIGTNRPKELERFLRRSAAWRTGR